MRICVSGKANTLSSAAVSFARMAGGVFAGASSPNIDVTTKSGKPASAAVGISGKLADRVGSVTASGRKPPDLMWGSAAGMVSIIACT